jgi:predicted ATPase
MQAGDRELLFRALSGLRLCYHFRAELKRALETGKELLAEAERIGDAALLVTAHWGIGQTLYSRGEFIEALQHYTHAADLAAAAGPKISASASFEWKLRPPMIKWMLGYPDQARRLRREALDYCRDRDLLSRTLAELFAGHLSHMLQEVDEAAQYAATAERLATEYGSLQAVGFARVLRGWASAHSGDPARGLEEIGRAMKDLDAAGTKLRSSLAAAQAESHLRLGQLQEGLEAVSSMLIEIEESEERIAVAEIHRIRGELLLRQGEPAWREAEAAFREAIAIARGQSAKSWELRATTSLARLLSEQGKREEARTMLAKIYNWFTEGFDTADLKDAKALLDESGA